MTDTAIHSTRIGYCNNVITKNRINGKTAQSICVQKIIKVRVSCSSRTKMKPVIKIEAKHHTILDNAIVTKKCGRLPLYATKNIEITAMKGSNDRESKIIEVNINLGN
jgi:hypothetical protein